MDAMDKLDGLEAVVDYQAESRAGGHVLGVAARSAADGVLQVELTVSDRGGEVVGSGELRLPPDLLPPAGRVLGQVLRGLTHLHTLPDVLPPPGQRDDGRRSRPNARRPWSDGEEERLRSAWAAGTPVAGIAADHGRSTNAIQSRLLKLGLITLDHPESPALPDGGRSRL
jgi:hypothetical protein